MYHLTMKLLWAVWSLNIIWNAKFCCSAPTITPRHINSCPEAEITLHCSAPNGTRLQWEVNFSSSSLSSIHHTFIGTESLGHLFRVINNRNYIFYFSLTSTFPLTSTMTTTAVQELEGATVSCTDNRNDVDVVIINIIKDPIVDNLSLQISHLSVQWNSKNVNYSNGLFIVTIFFVDTKSVFITSNTTIELPTVFNEEYNISIVATACGRNSTPASIIVFIGQCPFPTVGPSVIVEGYKSGIEGSQITYYCQQELVPTGIMLANCMSNGTWKPTPSELTCKAQPSDSEPPPIEGTLFTGTTLTYIITFGTLFFVIILVLIVVCLICSRKVLIRYFNNKETSNSDVIYDDIVMTVVKEPKLKVNEAYGSVHHNLAI